MLFFAVAHCYAFRARDFWPEAPSALRSDPSLAADLERQLQRTGLTAGGAAAVRRAGGAPAAAAGGGLAAGLNGESLVAAAAAGAAASAAAAQEEAEASAGGAGAGGGSSSASPRGPLGRGTPFAVPSSRAAAHGTLSGRGVAGVVTTLAKRAVSIAGCGDVRANVAGQVSDSVQSAASSGTALVGTAATRLSKAGSAASRSFRRIVPGSVRQSFGGPPAALSTRERRRRESALPLTASMDAVDGWEGEGDGAESSSAAAAGGAAAFSTEGAHEGQQRGLWWREGGAGAAEVAGGGVRVSSAAAAAHAAAAAARAPWLPGEPGARAALPSSTVAAARGAELASSGIEQPGESQRQDLPAAGAAPERTPALGARGVSLDWDE